MHQHGGQTGEKGGRRGRGKGANQRQPLFMHVQALRMHQDGGETAGEGRKEGGAQRTRHACREGLTGWLHGMDGAQGVIAQRRLVALGEGSAHPARHNELKRGQEVPKVWRVRETGRRGYGVCGKLGGEVNGFVCVCCACTHRGETF
eukprot:354286-Chlamydomonas_euryale.AAC.2